MATSRPIEIIENLRQRLEIIKTDNGYNTNVKFVDKEYREESYHQYPFIWVNDIKDEYVSHICKNLFKKVLILHIVGFVKSEATEQLRSKLGTEVQRFKEDVLKAINTATMFNSTDLQVQIIDTTTDNTYVPPQGLFVTTIAIQYYSEF